MRIGVDYTSAVNQRAGIGRFTRGLIGAVAAKDQFNDYVLYHARGRGMRAKPSTNHFPGLANFHEKALPISDRMLNIVWHRLGIPLPVDYLIGSVDLFYSPDYALPPLRRGASVVTVHDLSFLMEPQCADAGVRAYLEKAVPAAVAEADFVTADSEHTRNDIITLLDVPEDRVGVVYAGIEPSFTRVTDLAQLERTRRKYRLHFPFILHVGMIEPRKNIVRLIQAYRALRDRANVPHRLVIAGGLGWLYDDIFREVERLGLGDDVLFPGFVSDDDLPSVYTLASVLAYPSLYEGFGLPPVEAMACGTPVVCSNASSLPEVVGDAALTHAPADVEGLAAALGRVLEESELREMLVARGYARATRFTWPDAADSLLAIFRHVAGGEAADAF